MKSVFDTATREELITRINSLSLQSKTQWGKMNVFQMVRHCILCDEMMMGKIQVKRVFIGRLLGRMLLKNILKDDKPFGKNAPTSPLLKTTSESGDLEQQKKEWINIIERYAYYNNPNFIHPFFGSMTKEQVGLFFYKHTDHHLRQLGA